MNGRLAAAQRCTRDGDGDTLEVRQLLDDGGFEPDDRPDELGGQSIADALQFISYYHPLDYIQAVGRAYEREQSPAAKDALAQILTNSRMCAEGHRPICQDTGAVVVFLKIGMDVRFQGDMALSDMINEGVRRAYNHPDNVLRASVLADPDGKIAKAVGVPTRDGSEIVRTIDDEEVILVRGVTAARWTFIIDKQGKIVYKNTDVDAGQDSKTVLEFLKSMPN